MPNMIRLFDILIAIAGIIVGLPLIVVLILIGLIDTGSPIFRQERVGQFGSPFVLLKFRTMRIGTASTATHLASASAVTAFGKFLRRTKLDEIPQLWNVLKGDMSLVGPRPCLFSQEELIAEREIRRVFEARPGITGLAQLNGIDMSSPRLLAETDARMLRQLTFRKYVGMIAMTALGKGSGDHIRQSWE